MVTEERDRLVVVKPLRREPIEVVLGVAGCPRIHFSRPVGSRAHLIDVLIERGGETIELFSLTAPEQARLIQGLSDLGIMRTLAAVDPSAADSGTPTPRD